MTDEIFGRYQVIGEVGRGGMASVLRAYDPRFERDVAVKLLPRALLHDAQFRERFDREAKTVGLLEHPAIVPVYDFGEEDGQPYIVMRLMGGGSLTDRLKDGPLSLEETGPIITRLAEALDVAHSKGIIHRDLKPGNILFDEYGNAFLSDFGIAWLSEASSSLTGSQIIGTPAYMSPEQIQGDKEIDGRSDIYALGIILFHILTLEMPFKADTPAKLMMAHLLDPVPHISALRPDLPPGLDKVIEKSLQKDPDDRYLDGKELAKDYAKVMQGISGEFQSPPPVVQEELPTIRSPIEGVADGATVIPPREKVEAPPAKGFPRGVLFGILGLVVVAILTVGGLAVFGVLSGGRVTPVANLGSATPVQEISPTDEPTEIVVTPTQDEPLNTEVPVVVEDTPLPEPTATATIEPSPAPTERIGGPVEGGADKIAFVMDGEIHIANLDGTELVQLTTDTIPKTNLTWTPDGQAVAFITGKCIKFVTLQGGQDSIACFEIAQFLEGFSFSNDGQQIAISMNRELFLVPFDLETLQSARLRTDLIRMATCEHFAPFDRGGTLPAKDARWSNDGSELAVLVITPGQTGLQEDTIQVFSISDCIERPALADEFPGTRFTVDNYDVTPLLPAWDWDGTALFSLSSFIRNDGFGDLYLYNSEILRGEKINPIGDRCCYTGPKWSPDGRYLLFAFQDLALGAGSVTVLYYVPFGTLTAGGQLIPMDLPALTNPREFPDPALRPAITP